MDIVEALSQELQQQLPYCPKCEDDALWLEASAHTWRLRCRSCSLDSGIKSVPIGLELNVHVAKMIGVYRGFFGKLATALGAV